MTQLKRLPQALKVFPILLVFARAVALTWLAAILLPLARAQDATDAGFRPRFLELCDLAAAKVKDPDSKGTYYYVDSYAIRSLCAAYDLTGNRNYLDACRRWSERMAAYQDKMVPAGAYYMRYNREPGQTNGDWFVADSASIGMAVLATSVRCSGAERQRLLGSVKKFADLVIANYIKPSGGVTDGLWKDSSDEWWCSSGIFGSLSFLLYKETGDDRYLHAGQGVVDWLNQCDLAKPQPMPLSQQGPSMPMYFMETYSAGWPYIIKDEARRQASMAKITWCFHWIAGEQAKPVAERQWPIAKQWGSKFGGLPFHQYIFSRYLPEGKQLLANGDQEIRRIASAEFVGTPKLTQLTIFMLMPYAERLKPGAIYGEGSLKASP